MRHAIQAVTSAVQRVLIGIGPLVIAAACSHEEPFVRGPLDPAQPPAPSAEQVRQRLVLVGDAGAPSLDGEPVLLVLNKFASTVPDRTAVVFLGDNIYPAGLPAPDASGRRAAEQALEAQLAAAGDARALFIAGNHDWGFTETEGTASLERQSAWLRARSAELTPQAGCPGPSIHDFEALRIVALDTQWWLESEARRSHCELRESVQSGSLDERTVAALSPADDRTVVVVGHHPLRSRGPHGGFFTLQDWLIPSRPASRRWRNVVPPLPGLGPLWRVLNRSEQDLRSEENTRLRGRISKALAANPPLVYAAGHEHSLQVFDGEGVASLLLVSGAGSSEQATPVGHDSQTLFAHQHPGFMVLDVLDDAVLLRVIEPGTAGGFDWTVRYWKLLDVRE